MIEIDLIELAGVTSALKALHLPYGKQADSATSFVVQKQRGQENYRATWQVEMSDHDRYLLHRLAKAGDEHAKVARGIVAYLEINAPRYWWVEFDTYRIGCEKLASESTMHIQGKHLSEEDLVYMKSHLTEGTMQKRIVMVSYQTLRRMYAQRHTHRLPEWRTFCKFISDLPFSWLINDE